MEKKRKSLFIGIIAAMFIALFSTVASADGGGAPGLPSGGDCVEKFTFMGGGDELIRNTAQKIAQNEKKDSEHPFFIDNAIKCAISYNYAAGGQK